MSLGRTEVTRNNIAAAIAARKKRIAAAYESARSIAEQTLQNLCPEKTGALKRSSKAELLPDGIGFVLRS